MPVLSQAGRLLLTIHHLSVDGVSWRILLPDLAAAWHAIAHGQAPALPSRGSSFRRYAQRLAAHAQQPEVGGRAGVLAARCRRAPALPLVDGALDPRRDIAGAAGHVRLTLPDALTAALLTRVPAAFHGGINDVLLTGLALGVADWCARRRDVRSDGRRAGPSDPGTAVLLDLEGHGREELFADLDLSRTVGWYTSQFPVRLELGGLDVEAALAAARALGRRAQEHQGAAACAAAPRLGYGLLRYLNRETAAQLAQLCAAADRLQLSGPRGGFGSDADWVAAGEDLRLGGRDPAHAAEPCDRDRCAHARR